MEEAELLDDIFVSVFTGKCSSLIFQVPELQCNTLTTARRLIQSPQTSSLLNWKDVGLMDGLVNGEELGWTAASKEWWSTAQCPNTDESQVVPLTGHIRTDTAQYFYKGHAVIECSLSKCAAEWCS